MNRFRKYLLLGLTMVLIGAMALPMFAQEADPGAGNGGTVVESNIGDDPTTFNPILSNDTTSGAIVDFMYPDIIGLDDVTLAEAPNASQGLAIGWEYDETGTVVTITLRQDAFWSDGEQITADDYLYAFNAVKSGQTTSPRTDALYKLDNGDIIGGYIYSAEKVDDFTLRVTLGNVSEDDAGNVTVAPNCDALSSINDIAVVPSHMFEAQFGTDYASMDADPYWLPENDNGIATFGPFTSPFIDYGVQVSMLADQNYPDTVLGYVAPGQWILQQVEDTTVEYERFLAGDFTTIAVSPNNQNAMRTDERFQLIEYPGNGYTYMGFNLADPANPQPGLDDNGDYVPQGMHPIFGDKMVRQAIAHAIDVRTMIGSRPEGDTPATGILEGNGYPIAVHNHPGLSSIDPGLQPYAFDPELASQMLEQAGWVDQDGDGVRECHGCKYAVEVDAAYEGTPMEFELLTNAGNAIREAAGETIRAQLAEVGITVNYQAIEFGTLVDQLTGQQFDAIIIGWSLGLPFQPGDSMRSFFFAGNDRPGAGFAFTSYQNPELEALVEQAGGLQAAEDGSYGPCDEATRNAMYAQAMQMLYDDLPYVWLWAGNTMVATQGNVENYDPLPYNTQWNMNAWTIGD